MTVELFTIGLAGLAMVFSTLALRDIIRTGRALRRAKRAWERAAEARKTTANEWREEIR
jgi:uncharacterized membrane protein YciS (DUF1049 family)